MMEITPHPENDLPFTATKLRVGIGGDYLDLQMINDDVVTRIRNIADGEVIEGRIARICGSDCDNLVIFE